MTASTLVRANPNPTLTLALTLTLTLTLTKVRDRLDALRWRTKYLVGLATKDESRKGRAARVSKG